MGRDNAEVRRDSTSERVVTAATVAFGTRGYEATSLDAIASELGVRKQTILYHFGSKEGVLDAVIDHASAELVEALEEGLSKNSTGLGRVEAIVRLVFRLAARQPELLGLLREVSRLGPPPATRLRQRLEPVIADATNFLETEMAKGTIRRQDARLLLVTSYSTVIGVATEVEVLRALGVESTARSLVHRRKELLDFLRSALTGETPVTPAIREVG